MRDAIRTLSLCLSNVERKMKDYNENYDGNGDDETTLPTRLERLYIMCAQIAKSRQIMRRVGCYVRAFSSGER